MKTAIYIEDGIVQLVLTPEGEFEKNALSSFAKQSITAQIFEGTFYDCRGGWTRQRDYYEPSMYGYRDPNDKSIILRVARTPAEQPS